MSISDGTLYIYSSEKISSLKIFDINGRMVLYKNILSVQDYVDVSTIREGVFLIVAELYNRKIQTSKIKF